MRSQKLTNPKKRKTPGKVIIKDPGGMTTTWTETEVITPRDPGTTVIGRMKIVTSPNQNQEDHLEQGEPPE